MLIEFRFRNYRCFRDEQVLSMVASRDSELPENLITGVPAFGHDLLRTAAIYGPNASGKTTVLRALSAVDQMVRISPRTKPEDRFPVEPFLLDPQTRDASSFFEVTYVHERVRYQYGMEVDAHRVHREYLFAYPRGRRTMLFDRAYDASSQKDVYSFGASLHGPSRNIADLTRPNALYLSMCASLNHPVLTRPYGWFANTFEYNSEKWGGSIFVRIDEKRHAAIRTLLKSADLGIEDYRVALSGIPSEPSGLSGAILVDEGSPDAARFVGITLVHLAADGHSVEFPLYNESKGTLQLLDFSTTLLDALEGDHVLFVDELDASLHPLMTRQVIEMSKSGAESGRHMQLVFNTHDTTLMDNEVFRRDQIWFTKKDQQGAAHLYPLLDFRPRKDASLARGYLQGRYGAIPFLGEPPMLVGQEGC